jgi:hypothetical protein
LLLLPWFMSDSGAVSVQILEGKSPIVQRGNRARKDSDVGRIEAMKKFPNPDSFGNGTH